MLETVGSVLCSKAKLVWTVQFYLLALELGDNGSQKKKKKGNKIKINIQIGKL